MPEMTPIEAAGKLQIMACQYSHIRKNDWEWEAIQQAASYLRKIASGEYAPVVHTIPQKIKPTDPKALFEKQCPKCDSLLFATDNFCGICGALMDGKDDSHE